MKKIMALILCLVFCLAAFPAVAGEAAETAESLMEQAQALYDVRDFGKAVELIAKAADQAFPVAMFAVGDCYYLGTGAEKDLGAAAEWYQKALDAGYEPDETDQAHLKEVLGKDSSNP